MMLKKQVWVLILSLVGFGAALFLSPSAMGYRTLDSDGTPSLTAVSQAGVNSQGLSLTDVEEAVINDEPPNVDSSRILLWIAFIIAMVIFSLSVIGAIHHYSHRRPLK